MLHVLVLEHDHSFWAVSVYTSRRAAECRIRGFAQPYAVEGEDPPIAMCDCVELLVEYGEHVRLFRCKPNSEPSDEKEINFFKEAADRAAT